MIVYLTGGIGTGKSTVLRMFAGLGARTLSADEIVRDLYNDPAVQARVAGVLGMRLPLDRGRIASVVFADAGARRRLEDVLHPLVAARVARLRDDLPPSEPLIYEMPLPPTPVPGDVVIVVTAPERVRLERLVGRGMDPQDASSRMAAQPPADAYGKDADFTIVNDGDAQALRNSVGRVWEELQRGTSPV